VTDDAAARAKRRLGAYQQAIAQNVRRNAILEAASQVLLRLGWILKNETIVVAGFIHHLSGSPYALSVQPILSRICPFLPQLFVAGRVGALRRKKPFLLFAMLVYTLSWGLLAGIVFLVPGLSKALLLVIFLSAYTLFRLSQGFTMLARKTLEGKLIPADRRIMDACDDELPVFKARGVTFGIIICHDSSFPEIAATMAWKGARIIFSPHYNAIRRDAMDDHRIRVRNNHVGIAAHYGVVVARSNVVGYWPDEDRYGYGDSAIFAPNGAPLAEAGLFAEKLITADVAACLGPSPWRNRQELRPAILRQLHDAAMAALKANA